MGTTFEELEDERKIQQAQTGTPATRLPSQPASYSPANDQIWQLMGVKPPSDAEQTTPDVEPQEPKTYDPAQDPIWEMLGQGGTPVAIQRRSGGVVDAAKGFGKGISMAGVGAVASMPMAPAIGLEMLTETERDSLKAAENRIASLQQRRAENVGIERNQVRFRDLFSFDIDDIRGRLKKEERAAKERGWTPDDEKALQKEIAIRDSILGSIESNESHAKMLKGIYDNIMEWGNERFGLSPDASEAERWGMVAGSGVGSLAIGVALSYAMTPAFGGSVLAAQQAIGTYVDLRNEGVSARDAGLMAGMDFFWTSRTEQIPLEILTELARSLPRVARAVVGLFTEGAQEVIQQAGSNVIAGKPFNDQLLESGVGGGVAGLVVGALTPGHQKARIKPTALTRENVVAVENRKRIAELPVKERDVFNALLGEVDVSDAKLSEALSGETEAERMAGLQEAIIESPSARRFNQDNRADALTGDQEIRENAAMDYKNRTGDDAPQMQPAVEPDTERGRSMRDYADARGIDIVWFNSPDVDHPLDGYAYEEDGKRYLLLNANDKTTANMNAEPTMQAASELAKSLAGDVPLRTMYNEGDRITIEKKPDTEAANKAQLLADAKGYDIVFFSPTDKYNDGKPHPFDGQIFTDNNGKTTVFKQVEPSGESTTVFDPSQSMAQDVSAKIASNEQATKQAEAQQQEALNTVRENVGLKYGVDGLQLNLEKAPTTKQASVVEKFAKAIGKKVLWFSSDNAPFDGTIDGDKILIRVGAEQSPIRIATHEALHTMKREAVDLYNNFLQVVREQIGEDEFARFKQSLDKRYENAGVSPIEDSSTIWEELAAEVMGDRGTDKKFWSDLYAKSPEAVQRFIDEIKKVLDRLAVAIKGDPSLQSLFDDYTKIHEAAVEAMSEYSARMSQQTEQNVDEQIAPAEAGTTEDSAISIGPEGNKQLVYFDGDQWMTRHESESEFEPVTDDETIQELDRRFPEVTGRITDEDIASMSGEPEAVEEPVKAPLSVKEQDEKTRLEAEADRQIVVTDSSQIKSATDNVGAFGQRAITEDEAARSGMTVEEANAAQKAGDIRLSIRQPDDKLADKVRRSSFAQRAINSGKIKSDALRYLHEQAQYEEVGNSVHQKESRSWIKSRQNNLLAAANEILAGNSGLSQEAENLTRYSMIEYFDDAAHRAEKSGNTKAAQKIAEILPKFYEDTAEKLRTEGRALAVLRGQGIGLKSRSAIIAMGKRVVSQANEHETAKTEDVNNDVKGVGKAIEYGSKDIESETTLELRNRLDEASAQIETSQKTIENNKREISDLTKTLLKQKRQLDLIHSLTIGVLDEVYSGKHDQKLDAVKTSLGIEAKKAEATIANMLAGNLFSVSENENEKTPKSEQKTDLPQKARDAIVDIAAKWVADNAKSEKELSQDAFVAHLTERIGADAVERLKTYSEFNDILDYGKTAFAMQIKGRKSKGKRAENAKTARKAKVNVEELIAQQLVRGQTDRATIIDALTKAGMTATEAGNAIESAVQRIVKRMQPKEKKPRRESAKKAFVDQARARGEDGLAAQLSELGVSEKTTQQAVNEAARIIKSQTEAEAEGRNKAEAVRLIAEQLVAEKTSKESIVESLVKAGVSEKDAAATIEEAAQRVAKMLQPKKEKQANRNNIKKVITDHIKTQDGTNLVSKLQELGVSATTAHQIANESARMIKSQIERTLSTQKKARKAQKMNMADTIIDQIRRGVLDDEHMRNLFSEKYGLSFLSQETIRKAPEMAANLRDLIERRRKALRDSGVIPESEINSRVDDMPEVRRAKQAIMRELAKNVKLGATDLPWTYMYFAMLSGPTTTGFNMITNNSTSTMETLFVQTLKAGVQSLAQRDPRVFATHARAYLAIPLGLRIGLHKASNVYKTGLEDTGASSKFDARPDIGVTTDKVKFFREQAAGRGLANVLNSTWKALAAQDALQSMPLREYKTIVMAGEIVRARNPQLHGKAYWRAVADVTGQSKLKSGELEKIVNAMKLPPKQRQAELYDLMEVLRPQKVREGADKYRRDMLFNAEKMHGILGSLGTRMITLAHDHPSMKPFALFTRIGVNLGNAALDWFPVTGLFRAAMPYVKIGKLKVSHNEIYPGRRGDVLARAVTGIIGSGLIAQQAMKALQNWLDDPDKDNKEPAFSVTFTGPSDPVQRQAWRAAGNVPYSIRFGNSRAIRFWVFGPAAVMFLPAAIMSDAKRYNNDLTPSTFVAQYSFGFLRFLMDMLPFQTTTSFIDAISQQHDKQLERGLKRFVSSIAGMFDPKIFSQLYRMHDPRVFNSDDLHLMMFRNYPIVNSELMESSVNFWGDEIRISPMERFVGAKRSDTASKFILDNKLRLIPQYREEVIDRSVNPPVTRPMTDHEFRWYVVKSGKSFRDWVEANRVRLAKKNHDAMETEVQDAFNNIKRHWKRLALDKIARNVPLEYD